MSFHNYVFLILRNKMLYYFLKLRFNLFLMFSIWLDSIFVIWQNTSYELQVASYELRVESLKTQVEIQKCEFKSTSCKLKSTSYEFKSSE